MKKGLLIALGVIVLLIVLRPFAREYIDLINYNREIENLQIESPKIENLQDGEYEGEHTVYAIEARVRVRIHSGEIVAIDLEHEHERGYNAEEITERVIHAQSLGVDMVTGATQSSKVILKSIEKALCDLEEASCKGP